MVRSALLVLTAFIAFASAAAIARAQPPGRPLGEFAPNPQASCMVNRLTPATASALRRAWGATHQLPAGHLGKDILGHCGSTWYALIEVSPASSVPSRDRWRFQDGPQIFRGTSATQWTYVSDTGGDAPRCGSGTSAFPRALVRISGLRCV